MRSMSLALLLSCVAVAPAQKAPAEEEKRIEELIKQLDPDTSTLKNGSARVAAAKAIGVYGAKAEKALPALARLRDQAANVTGWIKDIDDAIARIVFA